MEIILLLEKCYSDSQKGRTQKSVIDQKSEIGKHKFFCTQQLFVVDEKSKSESQIVDHPINMQVQKT